MVAGDGDVHGGRRDDRRAGRDAPLPARPRGAPRRGGRRGRGPASSSSAAGPALPCRPRRTSTVRRGARVPCRRLRARDRDRLGRPGRPPGQRAASTTSSPASTRSPGIARPRSSTCAGRTRQTRGPGSGPRPTRTSPPSATPCTERREMRGLNPVPRYGSRVSGMRVGEVAKRAGVNVETLR